jgi:hypothetical protein
MPNYRESTVNGSTWQRCCAVTVRNPWGGAPGIEFHEERIIAVDGEDIHQGVAGCEKPFNPVATFPLLDPATNLPTGASMTHAEFYAVLYSLYMQTASERDARQV